jgi:hypothetical protein
MRTLAVPAERRCAARSAMDHQRKPGQHDESSDHLHQYPGHQYARAIPGGALLLVALRPRRNSKSDRRCQCAESSREHSADHMASRSARPDTVGEVDCMSRANRVPRASNQRSDAGTQHWRRSRCWDETIAAAGAGNARGRFPSEPGNPEGSPDLPHSGFQTGEISLRRCGRSTFFFSVLFSARAIERLVSRGSMTSSIIPRAAVR